MIWKSILGRNWTDGLAHPGLSLFSYWHFHNLRSQGQGRCGCDAGVQQPIFITHLSANLFCSQEAHGISRSEMGRLDLGIFSLRGLFLSRLDVVSLLPCSAAYPAGSNCVALGKRNAPLGLGRFWGPGGANYANHSRSSSGPAASGRMGMLPGSPRGVELECFHLHPRALPAPPPRT